jgi:hypothetical protein
LGSSTSKWANYPKFIAWAFQGLPEIRARNLDVKVYSTGFEAHTTLDSYYKYKYLYNGYDFDLVIIYHGINELRANNCPPEMFRDDYSHYSYYKTVNSAVKLFDIPLLNRSFLALKIILSYQEFLKQRIEASHPGGDAYIAEHDPNPQWMHYGKEVRSAFPFKRNMENILRLAQERKQRVLLMTFASCFPPNYNRSAFETGLIPYGEGMDEGVPIELFGLPDNVRQGLIVHNEIIRELALKYDCYFLDQAKLMNDNLDYFIDVCHFSHQGITAFAINIGRYFFTHPQSLIPENNAYTRKR